MGDNLDGSREDKSSHELDRLGLRDNGHRVCRGKVERAAGADRTLKLPRVDLTILATFSLPSNIFSFFFLQLLHATLFHLHVRSRNIAVAKVTPLRDRAVKHEGE